MGKFVKQDVREWCPSTTGPLLPTMTDSLLAPGRKVLSKLYRIGELVEATILGPSGEGDDFVRLKYTRNGRGDENLSAPLSALSSICAHPRRCHQHHRRRHHSPLLSAAPPLPHHVLPFHPVGMNHTKQETQWEEPPPAYWRPPLLCALNGLGILCLGMCCCYFTMLPRTEWHVQRTRPFRPYFLRTKLFVGHGGEGLLGLL